MFNIYRLRDQLNQNKWYRLAFPFLRGALMFLIYLAMCSVLVPYFYKECIARFDDTVPYPQLIGTALLIFLLYLFLNTVILAFAIYNRNEREAFLAQNSLGFSQEDARAAILHSRDTWFEILTFALCFALFPTMSGWRDLFKIVTPYVEVSPVLQRVIVSLLFAAWVCLLTLKNKTEVRTYWLEATDKMMKKSFWKSLSSKKASHYSVWRLALRLIWYTVLYAALIFMLSFMVPVIISLVKIVWLFVREGWYWFIPVLLILPGVYYGLAFRHRRRFMRDLRALCRAEGYELFDLKHPYLSIFRDGKSYTFGIRNAKKTYTCRILAGVRRSNNMYLSDDGKCVRSFGIHAPTARMARSGPFVQVHVRKDDSEELEMFRVTSTSNYTFEGEGEKVLIINPVPRKVYIKNVGQRKHEVDNGDRINEYSIYTGNAFLRKLEREDPLK